MITEATPLMRRLMSHNPNFWMVATPAYAQNFLPASVTSRPLKGDAPTVDLVLGYRKSNQSPILKLLLSRVDELVARASNKTR